MPVKYQSNIAALRVVDAGGSYRAGVAHCMRTYVRARRCAGVCAHACACVGILNHVEHAA